MSSLIRMSPLTNLKRSEYKNSDSESKPNIPLSKTTTLFS